MGTGLSLAALAFAFAAGQEDIGELIGRLGSADADVVRQARRRLTDLEAEAIGPLQAALRKAEGSRAENIRFTLRMIEIRRRLPLEVSMAYLWVEERIAENPKTALPDLLRKMLRDREALEFREEHFRVVTEMALEADPVSTDGRLAILRSVQSNRFADLVPALVAYLRDPSERVREYAAYLIVTFRSEKAAGKVLELVRTGGDPASRIAGMKVLAHLRLKEAAPIMAELLEDADPSVRLQAIDGLVLLGAKGFSGKVVARLADTSAQVREAAASALVALGAHDRVSDIAAYLDPRQPKEVRRVALKTLAHLNDPGAAAPVAGLLNDPDEDLKRMAIAALGRLGHPASVDPLLRMVRESPKYREDAAEALRRIGVGGHVPELVDLVFARDEGAGRIALKLLDGVSAAPLVEMLKGKDDTRARRAATLLGLGRFEGAREKLLAARKEIPGGRRMLVLLVLCELGEKSTFREACEWALDPGPLQHELLFALNGVKNGDLYRRLGHAGLRRLNLKGTVREVLEHAAKLYGTDIVISDRCNPGALKQPVQLEGLKSARQAFATLSRLSGLGYLFGPSVIRVVPLEEPLRVWEREIK